MFQNEELAPDIRRKRDKNLVISHSNCMLGSLFLHQNFENLISFPPWRGEGSIKPNEFPFALDFCLNYTALSTASSASKLGHLDHPLLVSFYTLIWKIFWAKYGHNQWLQDDHSKPTRSLWGTCLKKKVKVGLFLFLPFLVINTYLLYVYYSLVTLVYFLFFIAKMVWMIRENEASLKVIKMVPPQNLVF